MVSASDEVVIKQLTKLLASLQRAEAEIRDAEIKINSLTFAAFELTAEEIRLVQKS
jgi:hypothetical protein